MGNEEITMPKYKVEFASYTNHYVTQREIISAADKDQIYDIYGKVVSENCIGNYNKGINTINLSLRELNLNDGLYIIVLNDGITKQVSKIQYYK